MSTSLSHLDQVASSTRAALLLAEHQRLVVSIGTDAFRPLLSRLLARFAAEAGREENHVPLEGYTIHTMSRGGHHRCSLFRGRRGLEACRNATRQGDHGILDAGRGEARADRRILDAILDPGAASSLWTLVASPAATTARNALLRPHDHQPLWEEATRLPAPDPVTSIPLHALRARGDLTLTEAAVEYLDTHGLTQGDIARELGIKHAAQVRLVLRNARAKRKAAQDATHGPVRPPHPDPLGIGEAAP